MRIIKDDVVYEAPGLTPDDGDTGEAAGAFRRVPYTTPYSAQISKEEALRLPETPETPETPQPAPVSKPPATRRTRTKKENS